MPEDVDEARCRYATQIKSWYDEQYNDWAERYLRERLYNADGVDRGADYLYDKLLPPVMLRRRKRISPTKPIQDREYLVTECTPSLSSYSKRAPVHSTSAVVFSLLTIMSP